MPATVSPLDETRLRTLAGWFFCGMVLVLAAQAVKVWCHGGKWTHLLRVGAVATVRPRIERELGAVEPPDAEGHDGQIYYMIARDPLGRQGVPDLLGEPRYRYRRIFYPLVAGAGGQFGPWPTLWGLVIWAACGAGLATAAVADLCRRWQLERWTVLLALINPGVWLSALILTPDALALGLALTGIALWLRGHRSASIGLLALAALTKETYALAAVVLAVWSWPQRRWGETLALALVPLAPLVIWSVWMGETMAASTQPLRNFGWPFAGIAVSVPLWFQPSAGTDAGDIVLGFLALALVGVAVILSFRCRDRLLVWLNLTWALLGIVLSADVWGLANNALRVLAPLWAFTALSLSVYLSQRRNRQRSPSHHG